MLLGHGLRVHRTSGADFRNGCVFNVAPPESVAGSPPQRGRARSRETADSPHGLGGASRTPSWLMFDFDALDDDEEVAEERPSASKSDERKEAHAITITITISYYCYH